MIWAEECTASRVLALHMADMGLIPDIPHAFLNPLGMNPKIRTRSNT